VTHEAPGVTVTTQGLYKSAASTSWSTPLYSIFEKVRSLSSVASITGVSDRTENPKADDNAWLDYY